MDRVRTALALPLLFAIAACSGERGLIARVVPLDTIGGGPSSRMSVAMGDSPAHLGGKSLQHLYLGIRRVEAAARGERWILANYAQPLVVDVLAYQGNAALPLGSSSVPAQAYGSLILVADRAASRAVFADGSSVPLTFLAGQSSKSSAGAGMTTATIADGTTAVDLVTSQSFSAPENAARALRVDFNAFESLALTSSGAVQALPALFVAPIDRDGAISGTVKDRQGTGVAGAVVVALDAHGSVANTAQTDANGSFALGTLNPGTYRLRLYNLYTNAAGQLYHASGESVSTRGAAAAQSPMPDVNVTAGATTSGVTLSD